MGKIIKMPNVVESEIQRQCNVRKLKLLIHKYIKVNKRDWINKIKTEQ